MSSNDIADYSLGDALIQKAHRGKLQEVIFLVEEAKVDINYSNKHGCTALHSAAAAGQLEVTQWLTKQSNIDLTAVDDQNQTPLHYAAFHGHLEVVQLLIDQSVPLNLPDQYGRLMHTAAAINGHLDVVTYVLEECSNPIDINAMDEYGGTCLHWAALKGRKEVVQYLCHKGIDAHVTSYDNRTAFQLAKDKHKHKCVQFLKSWMERSQQFVNAAERGDEADIKRISNEVNKAYPLRYLKDKDGRNALHWAASKGHLSVLKMLCEIFDVLTDVDKCGRNALHWAAVAGHKECAQWLVKKSRGTSLIHTLSLTNKSPSRCAFEAGHSALAAKLQSWEEGLDEVLGEDKDEKSSDTSQYPSDAQSDVKDVAKLRDMNTVQSWLAQVELDEYTMNFARDGFDTLRGVATIDEHDLIDMKVKKGHRRVVLSRIADLRQQLAALDENCQSNGLEPDAAPTLEMVMGASRNTIPNSTIQSPPPNGESDARVLNNSKEISKPEVASEEEKQVPPQSQDSVTAESVVDSSLK